MLSEAVFSYQICSAQTLALSKFSRTLEIIERRMSAYQTEEPCLDFLEKAGLGRRFHLFPDVILTYDSRSGSMFD